MDVLFDQIINTEPENTVTNETLGQEVVEELFSDLFSDVDTLEKTVVSSDDTSTVETWNSLVPLDYIDNDDESNYTLEPVADVGHTFIDEISHQEKAQTSQEGRGRKRPSEPEKENAPPKKKFRCSTCDKTFTRANNLKQHEKTHKGIVKKFECSYCKKTFGSKFNKNRHEREVHEKELKCDKCGVVFENKDDFTSHSRTAHKKRKLQETEDNLGIYL